MSNNSIETSNKWEYVKTKLFIRFENIVENCLEYIQLAQYFQIDFSNCNDTSELEVQNLCI